MKMKTKIHSIIILLFAFFTVNTFAQIPNSGFENWRTYTSTCNGAPESYASPMGWIGGRATACGGGYSIQKVTDNYPIGTGQYSILVESNNANGILGVAFTANTPGPAKPAFPIIGHPTSLTGYYEFAPLNGDTMQIAIELFKNGSIVSRGAFRSMASISNWTSFNIPLPTYTSVDSGYIALSSYIAGGSPHGNSALSVDNLNFDNLIAGISQVASENKISVYPNPFSTATTLQANENLKDATLTVYNSLGQQVKQIKDINGQTITFQRDNLSSGVYFILLTQVNKLITTTKLIILSTPI